jgi:hypothetical protein
MKKTIVSIFALSSLVVFAGGCTDASRGKITAIGSPAHIVCYSGGKVIYDGHSTGKILSEKDSDGYFFKSRETGDFQEVSGQCIITYGK